jgi:hypothetical protein
LYKGAYCLHRYLPGCFSYDQFLIMKVLLLIVAIYALIINQALKQVDRKPVTKVKKNMVIHPPNHIYVDASSGQDLADPAMMIKYRLDDKDLPSSGDLMIQPGKSKKQVKPQHLLYPLDYSYPASMDKRKS